MPLDEPTYSSRADFAFTWMEEVTQIISSVLVDTHANQGICSLGSAGLGQGETVS